MLNKAFIDKPSAGGIGSETDPIFTAWLAAPAFSTDITLGGNSINGINAIGGYDGVTTSYIDIGIHSGIVTTWADDIGVDTLNMASSHFLTSWTFDNAPRLESSALFKEITDPVNNFTGYHWLYVKSDHRLYTRDPHGTVHGYSMTGECLNLTAANQTMTYGFTLGGAIYTTITNTSTTPVIGSCVGTGTTASASYPVRPSPISKWNGIGYNTSASQGRANSIGMYVLPVSGATTSGELIFLTDIVDGTWIATELMRISSSGTIRMNHYSTNGFVKFSGSNGTLAVDTATYLTAESDPIFDAWLDNPVLVNGLRTPTIKGVFGSDSDFTIALIPDSQFMSQTAHRTLFTNMIDWIQAQRVTLNIKAVVGGGDITNTAASGDMSFAKDKWAELRDDSMAVLPILGNHDYSTPSTRTASTYATYFGPSFFAGFSYYDATTYPATNNRNYCIKLAIGTRNYLIIGLEVFPGTSAITWAQGRIDANPGYEVIVCTHAYMTPGGSRINDLDPKGKSSYTFADTPHNGDELWDEFISVNPAIILLTSGHWSTATSYLSHLSDVGVEGNIVNQVFADFQQHNYGDGTCVLFKFRPATGVIEVRSYSTVDSAYVGSVIYLPYESIVAKTAFGSTQNFHIVKDLSVQGQAIFGTATEGVRLQSEYAQEPQTSYLDISFHRYGNEDGDLATFDAPNDCSFHFNYFHGSDTTYFHDGTGTGDRGDIVFRDTFCENVTAEDRVTALEFYNGYIFPRHPNMGATSGDVGPPDFGSGGTSYADISAPTMGTFSGCTQYEIDFRNATDGCGNPMGSKFAPYETAYYYARSYINIGGTKYFSSGYSSATYYGSLCQNMDYRIALNSLPAGATGVRIYQSWYDSGSCTQHYYFFDIEGTGQWDDNASGIWSECGCGVAFYDSETTFLPYTSGSSGEWYAEEYHGTGCGCGFNTYQSSAEVRFRAYFYYTDPNTGVKYFTTTYTEWDHTTGSICDIKLSTFGKDSSMTGIRIYKGRWFCDCQGGRWVYDYYWDSESYTASINDNTSNAWTNGAEPSNFLPHTVGGDTIPNDTLWFDDVATAFAYKDVGGSIHHLAWS